MFWDKPKKDIQHQLDRISDKMEQHDKANDVRLDNIEKVLIVQEQNLKEHMRRSDHLEKLIESEKDKMYVEIEPIKKQVNMISGGIKVLGVLGVITSVVGGILKIFNII